MNHIPTISHLLITLMMVNKMYIKLEVLWNEVTKVSTYGGYRINKDKYSDFLDEFLEKYNTVKALYMKEGVQYLDRYKVAAIIIFSMINTKVLEPNKAEREDWIIKNNELALCAGLAYLQNEYNQECCLTGNRPIDRYSFPLVKKGTTSYLDTIVKMLYHLDTKESANILPIATLLLTLEGYNIAGTE